MLLDLSDATDEIQELLERENRQEMERLLYVALTRAQHTLVLAFDNELFGKASGEIHSHSQSKWLKADKNDVNEAAFAAATMEPTSCSLTTERHGAKSRARLDKIDNQLPGGKINKLVAIQNATVFVRKLNPSDLPSEESAALEEIRYPAPELPRSSSPALQYGLWWHDFIQRLPWNGNPDSWNRVFDQKKSISPDFSLLIFPSLKIFATSLKATNRLSTLRCRSFGVRAGLAVIPAGLAANASKA
jgi:ATP-dependent exoDNAse (exonuclease V) beta subunit